MENMLKDENLLWSGRPSTAPWVLGKIFDYYGTFSLVWLALSAAVFYGFYAIMGSTGNIMINGRYAEPKDIENIYAVFNLVMLFYTVPVWVNVLRIALAFLSLQNAYYAITDNAVYIAKGYRKVKWKRLSLKKVTDVKLHRSFGNVISGAGSVYFYGNWYSNSEGSWRNVEFKMCDVKDYPNAYNAALSAKKMSELGAN